MNPLLGQFEKYYMNPLEIQKYLGAHPELAGRFSIRDYRKFSKSDAPIISTTTGVWMVLYGEAAFVWMNLTRPTWRVLAKKPWIRDGFRIVTASPSPRVTGIEGDAGTLPETRKPTFATEELDSKWMVSTYDVSEKARQHASRNEGINLDAWYRQHMAQEHAKGINEDLWADASAAAAAASAARAAADKYQIESIDRMISNGAEEDDMGGSYDSWFDAYGSGDRDSGTTYDSVVLTSNGDLTGFGTDRALSLSVINKLIRTVLDNGANLEDLFFMTKRDTADSLSSLLEGKQRFMGTTRRTITINGVESVAGEATGFEVESYRGIPVFTDPDVPADTIGRLYLLDGASIHVQVMIPTMYITTRGVPANWILKDKFADESAYLTVAELKVERFNTSGKIRDLS